MKSKKPKIKLDTNRVRFLLPSGNYIEVTPVNNGIEIRHVDMSLLRRMILLSDMANVVRVVETNRKALHE